MARNQTENGKEQRETVAPTLIAYHVAKRGKDSFWTRIGAAWEHKDGEGFSIQLDLLPTDGGRIVLRPKQEKPDDQVSTQQEGA